MQNFLDLFISTDALHVSGDSFAHHQDHKNYTYSFRYCQPLLLLAAIVDEMERISVGTGRWLSLCLLLVIVYEFFCLFVSPFWLGLPVVLKFSPVLLIISLHILISNPNIWNISKVCLRHDVVRDKFHVQNNFLPKYLFIRVIKTNLMHYLSSVYFVSKPLHVSGIFVAHHQELYCTYITIDTWCAFYRCVVMWLQPHHHTTMYFN